MDMILLMHVKKICTEYDGNNFEIVKEKIKEYCLKVLNDGTKYFLDEIDSSENLSAIQKKEYSAKFISKFSKAFNQGNGKPLLKKGYYMKTSEIYNISKDSHVSNEAIYNLYNYYSKYDHLSHWTSISGKIDFKDRKGKLDLSINLMLFYLRDLLSIALDFADNFQMLSSYIDDLQNELEKNHKDEQADR